MAQCASCWQPANRRQIEEFEHRIHLLKLKGFLEAEIGKDYDNRLSKSLDCVNFLLESIGAGA
jgi:hypothetical protein